MGVSSLEDCLQEMIPLLPEITLHPETSNSKHQKSGFCCQSTKPPLSSVFLTLTLSSPWWKSDELIFTCPIAHILYTEFNAGCPPVAAMYCCTIYFAVDDSCQMLHASAFIQNSSHIYIYIYENDLNFTIVLNLNQTSFRRKNLGHYVVFKYIPINLCH